MVPKYEREPDTEKKERGRRDRLRCASLCRRRRRRHLVAVCVPHHLSPSFASLAVQAGGQAGGQADSLALRQPCQAVARLDGDDLETQLLRSLRDEWERGGGVGVEGGEGSEMSTLENTANTTQWTAPARHLLCSVSDEMTMRIFFKAGGTAEQKRGERGRVCGVDVRLAGTPRFLSPLAMGRRTSERTDGRTDGPTDV